MRIIHLFVIAALVFAAAYVYRIKMESTARTERVLRLHAEIREQREAIASLRAEWARLDAPERLQGLADRHLPLKPLVATQYDSLKNLPERPQRYIYTKYDLSFPIELTLETMEALRRHNIKHSEVSLPCGHYTLGEKPWVYIDGYKIISYLRKHLR